MGLLKFIFSKTFLVQIGLAIVAFGVIVFAFSQWMASTTNHDVFTEVPNLEGKKLESGVGRTYDEIMSKIKSITGA